MCSQVVVNAVDGATEYVATDETMGTDPIGLGEETLIIVDGVRLATRASSKQWRDQVLRYVPFDGTKALEDAGQLLKAIGIEPSVPAAFRARCP